jgi:hypothetical protein
VKVDELTQVIEQLFEGARHERLTRRKRHLVVVVKRRAVTLWPSCSAGRAQAVSSLDPPVRLFI